MNNETHPMALSRFIIERHRPMTSADAEAVELNPWLGDEQRWQDEVGNGRDQHTHLSVEPHRDAAMVRVEHGPLVDVAVVPHDVAVDALPRHARIHAHRGRVEPLTIDDRHAPGHVVASVPAVRHADGPHVVDACSGSVPMLNPTIVRHPEGGRPWTVFSVSPANA
jgi:hypothetical protein